MELSATRLYASSIAIVSGIYALASAFTAGMASGIGGFLMGVVGAIVLVHGAVLLTPAIGLLRSLSGPLMVVWAVIMLLIQTVGATMPGFGMAAGSPMTADMGWDAGMVAIAILMLVSGLIMIRGRSHAAM